MYTVQTNENWFLFYRWPSTPTNGIWILEHSVGSTNNFVYDGNEMLWIYGRDANGLRTISNSMSGLRYSMVTPANWPGQPQLYYRVRRLR